MMCLFFIASADNLIQMNDYMGKTKTSSKNPQAYEVYESKSQRLLIFRLLKHTFLYMMLPLSLKCEI